MLTTQEHEPNRTEVRRIDLTMSLIMLTKEEAISS